MWYSLWLGAMMSFLTIGPAAPIALGGDRIVGKSFATRSVVYGRHAMAATSQPLATQAALDILKKGGSAVDAAIAANAVLAVTEPTGCGPGGDLFAIVWDAKKKELIALNASGRSPGELTLEHLQREGLKFVPDFGPLPVTVPGCVDGWFTLHERFGKLPMRDILAPAIQHARSGFPVSDVIAHYWRRGASMRDYPGFAETFLRDGRGPNAGERWTRPSLATTFDRISAGGRDAFYRGDIADEIDAFCRRTGCFLRKRDLAEHRSEWLAPVSTNYRGYDIWEIPPNGQGIAALQMLNILEGFDLRAMGFGSPAALHHMIEAKKIAFEDRARYYADPGFSAVPTATLISKQYAATRSALLNPQKAQAQYPAGETDLRAADVKLRGGDTIYLTVADENRNMVSLIQSNYRGFGSGLCPESLGFCLQDRGAQFSLTPGHPNCYAPGKRPFHTIIPAFVTRNGAPFLSFGVMGGDMQPQGHVQVLCNIIDFDMNLQEAGDAPRWYHTGSSDPDGHSMIDGGKLALEAGLRGAADALRSMGHTLHDAPGAFGGYQAIGYDAAQDIYIGASESRKDGCAMGY
ncbi:MAG: gamma-glutamyltransferase family protein [Phycisphaerales bacterium]|nr:gamma-glutamyltransferase family protein [Phycisphaerales bacterium]